MSSLCIDARWLYSGIGTYTFNMVRELGQCPELELHCITMSEHRAKLQPLCDRISIVDVPIYSVREQFAIERVARKFSVLHVPHYNAPLLRSGTLLITIHDLTHILDDQLRNTWKSRLYARPMMRMAAKKAAHIFTDSAYSKRQILEHLDVPAEKVTVSYLGVGPQFSPECREMAMQTVQRECGVKRPYVLYVGNLKPHKNVTGLLRAFALAQNRTARDYELLIIGDDSSGGELTGLAAGLGIGAVTRFAGRVSDDTLRSAYSAADLTVLPSFEEGFGLPVLESMACGTPVACSRAASLPEVGGDAAEYFDPRDCDSIATAMERVLSATPEDRAELQRKGFEQAGRYTWSACAKRHLEVYRRYLSTVS